MLLDVLEYIRYFFIGQIPVDAFRKCNLKIFF